MLNTESPFNDTQAKECAEKAKYCHYQLLIELVKRYKKKFLCHYILLILKVPNSPFPEVWNKRLLPDCLLV